MAESRSYGSPIVMERIPVDEWPSDQADGMQEEIDDDAAYDDDYDTEYSSDEIDDIYESQLLDAQQQWDESIQQLNKVLNWVLLPIIGKFMGRRVAKTIWQRVMEQWWR